MRCYTDARINDTGNLAETERYTVSYRIIEKTHPGNVTHGGRLTGYETHTQLDATRGHTWGMSHTYTRAGYHTDLECLRKT